MIYSQSKEEHKEHVRLVLERLWKFKLYTKLSKCIFHTQEIRFLGFIILTAGIKMEPERI
jgi:hypothetical protein